MKKFGYQRYEDESKIIIRFPGLLFLNICTVLGGILVVIYFVTKLEILFLGIVPCFYGIFIFSGNRKVYSEVKRRMKENGGKVYGSKWSLANPLTFEFHKTSFPVKD